MGAIQSVEYGADGLPTAEGCEVVSVVVVVWLLVCRGLIVCVCGLVRVVCLLSRDVDLAGRHNG